MFDFQQSAKYWVRTGLKVALVLGVLVAISLAASLLAVGSLVWHPLGTFIVVAAFLPAEEIAAWFVQVFYGLETRGEARGFLMRQVFGQYGARPYLLVKEGEVGERGDAVVQKIGGPALLIVYNDSAVVLERAGRLTRVVRGSSFVRLEPFEKVWDMIDLRPQRWVFPVSAMTKDGIPITYEADIRFQVGGTEADIFRAATSKWVKEASCSEPDRLRTWIKRVVIGFAEGSLRGILARYNLDQLIDGVCRAEVRAELERRLVKAVPNVGARLLSVELGDLKLKDKVIEQWLEVWKADRNLLIQVKEQKGQHKRAVELEEVTGEVRKEVLEQTLDAFQTMNQNCKEGAARSLLLCCINIVKQTACNTQGFIFPTEALQALEMVEKRIVACEGDCKGSETVVHDI